MRLTSYPRPRVSKSTSKKNIYNAYRARLFMILTTEQKSTTNVDDIAVSDVVSQRCFYVGLPLEDPKPQIRFLCLGKRIYVFPA